MHIAEAVVTDFPNAPDQLVVDEELLLVGHQLSDGTDGISLRYGARYQGSPAGIVELYGRQDTTAKLAYVRISKPEFEHRGIITRAARRLCHCAFTELGINEIQSSIRNSNVPSVRVARRLGAQPPALGLGFTLWTLHQEDLL